MFLHETETLSKRKDRLVEQLISATQLLGATSVGKHKQSLICQLATFVSRATVDTRSDLDLVSLEFTKPRANDSESEVEKTDFADCSVGYTVDVVRTSFVVGSMSESKFYHRGKQLILIALC